MDMKYHELERILRKIGCYPTGEQESGHPLWHSPITGNDFTMSNHHSREIAKGTLLNIMKLAGLKQ